MGRRGDAAPRLNNAMRSGCTARVLKPFAWRHLICFPKTRKSSGGSRHAAVTASPKQAKWRRV